MSVFAWSVSGPGARITSSGPFAVIRARLKTVSDRERERRKLRVRHHLGVLDAFHDVPASARIGDAFTLHECNSAAPRVRAMAGVNEIVLQPYRV